MSVNFNFVLYFFCKNAIYIYCTPITCQDAAVGSYTCTSLSYKYKSYTYSQSIYTGSNSEQIQSSGFVEPSNSYFCHGGHELNSSGRSNMCQGYENSQYLHTRQQYFDYQCSSETHQPQQYQSSHNPIELNGHIWNLNNCSTDNPTVYQSQNNYGQRDGCLSQISDVSAYLSISQCSTNSYNHSQNGAIQPIYNKEPNRHQLDQAMVSKPVDDTVSPSEKFIKFSDIFGEAFVNLRVVSNLQFCDIKNQSIDKNRLKCLITSISKIDKIKSRDNIKKKILTHIKQNGFCYEEKELDILQESEVLSGTKKIAIKNDNATDLCDDVNKSFQRFTALIKDQNSFADNQQVFVGFILATVLQMNDTNGYELKPDVCKIQVLMFELRPYLFFRLAMDKEPDYDENLNLKYSFVKEMGYIKELLILLYSDCLDQAMEDKIISMKKVVANYRKLIFELLHAKQYRQSLKFYFYKHGYYFKITGKGEMASFATQNMLYMLAFAPHPKHFMEIHKAITKPLRQTKASIRKSNAKKKSPSKMRKGNKGTYEYFKRLLFFDNLRNHDLHAILVSMVNEFKQLRECKKSNNENLQFFAMFRNETWVLTFVNSSKILLLRLTSAEIYVYFFNILFREFAS